MRVRNGKITDHWGVGNFFSLMQQLGALPVTTDGNGSESVPRRARLPPRGGKQHERAREKSRLHQRCKYTNSELLKKQGPMLNWKPQDHIVSMQFSMRTSRKSLSIATSMPRWQPWLPSLTCTVFL